MKLIFVMVAWNTLKWVQKSIPQFLEHFDDYNLLVVDNNSIKSEEKWIQVHADEADYIKGQKVIYAKSDWPYDNSYSRRSHGLGIDFAKNWCVKNGYDVIIHIEPDCGIFGRKWFDNILAAYNDDTWMIGSCRLTYGPIHPTPALFILDKFQHTFGECRRAYDVLYPKYYEVFNIKPFFSSHVQFNFWCKFWDTAQKNWFEAAIRGKTVLVEKADDFIHYWNGSDHDKVAEKPKELKEMPIDDFLSYMEVKGKQ